MKNRRKDRIVHLLCKHVDSLNDSYTKDMTDENLVPGLD